MSESRDFVEEQRSSIRSSLVEAIDKGRHAVASADGVAVLAILRPDTTVSFFAVKRDGRMVVDHASGTVAGVLSPESLAAGICSDFASGRRDWTNDEPLMRDLFSPVGQASPQASRRAALRVAREFARAYDVMADMAAYECSGSGLGELAVRRGLYDTMRRADGVSEEIVHNWPWAVPGIFDRKTQVLSPGPSPRAAVAAAEGIFRNLRDEVNVQIRPGLVKAMEGLRGLITDANNEWTIDDAICTFNDLPPEWIPSGNCHDDPEEWAIAIDVAHAVFEIAHAVGRRPRSLIGKFPGSWHGLAENFSEAVGLEFYAKEPTYDATESCRDMVDAFERQVLLPAMRCAGVEVPHGSGAGNLVDGENHHVRAAALRLLVGEKGLVAFGESAARWHARVTDLAKSELALSGDHETWSVPFEQQQFWTSDGVLIQARCLASASQFLDEGADGVDFEGVEGLGHCIASYASRVRRAGEVVVSIRRVDEEGRTHRLSTAHFVWSHDEKRLFLDQHHGRRNVRPPSEAVEAAQIVGRTLAGHKWTRTDDVGAFFAEGDRAAVAAMISAWSFALPKAARSWTPEDLVAASGLAADEPMPDAPGP